MVKYKVIVGWQAFKEIEVEAENERQAYDKAKDITLKQPDEGINLYVTIAKIVEKKGEWCNV